MSSLSGQLTSCLELVINFCNKAHEHYGINYLWMLWNMDKLRAFDGQIYTIAIYDSRPYILLHCQKIKQKVMLIMVL